MEDPKSAFFTNLSHEFRTPLTLILGPIEDLIERTHNPEDKKELVAIRSNAQRLLELVNQLLDLAKAESHELTLNEQSFDLNALLQGVCNAFYSAAHHKKIEIVSDFPSESIFMFADPDKLQTCVFNLLSNALKFTPENKCIYVSATAIGQDVQITVRDEGIGIKKEKQDKIFDRFFQAEQYFKTEMGYLRNEPGTGVGLALSKTLVELHQGSIVLESDTGKGSCFILHFKDRLKQEGVVLTDSIGMVDFAESNAVNHSKHPEEEKPVLLIVDDNKDILNFIKSIFESDFSITLAENGEEALSKAYENVPDLIISDVMMPGMSGIELCEKIKSKELTSHIPFILITADAAEATRFKGLELGVDDFLLKPFQSKELRNRAINLIEGRKRLKTKFTKELFIKDGEELNSMDEAFLKRIQDAIESNLDNSEFSVEDLADIVNLSRTQVHRKLKAISGLPATACIRNYRLQKAKILIEEQVGSISEVAYSVGFASPGYFTKSFKELFGYLPRESNNA